ncbi:serine hydrolase domain-containing protein [Sabulibacter ruber]|uniref:serine hydrolase domain-containing protein n=1 Tax=Sabulibacter ruber TaxID=2811901 RepID=UPI001A96FFCB|nr:serine hydrolase [Sabulibacter ruber]
MSSSEIKLKMVQLCLCLGVLTAFSCSTFAQRNENKQNQSWLQQHKEAGKSIVLLNNQSGLVPLQDLQQKIASVSIEVEHAAQFDSLLNKYTSVTAFPASVYDQKATYSRLAQDLASFSTVIVQVKTSALKDHRTIAFLENLQHTKQVIVAAFGNVSNLEFADALTMPIIWSEKETPVTANYAAQLVFGGVPATATLDKALSAKYTTGTGFKTAPTRLKYTVPEEVGIKSETLHQSVDAIVNEAIQQQATPGAVVLVAKDGKVVFNKAYGSHTYDKTQATQITDIFDLASVTKVSATTMAVMNLYDQHKIGLDSTFGQYVPSARNTNKADIKVKDLLLHQSGLPAGVFLPLQKEDVSLVSTPKYTIKVSDSAYLRSDYFQDVIWPRMLNAKMGDKNKYVYADVSMYYLKEAVERQAKVPLDSFVSSQFYLPLGMQTAGFLPLNRFPQSRIVPTEFDGTFRKSLLRGYVHDGGAARMGGVSGHAGLFATANDLAILYQMMLNGGSYGGKQYIQPQTVQLFTSKQSAVSRRRLGFDGWDADSVKGYPAKLASPETYGHTGYTGTCVWVDPKSKLVFVFLSNRVHPKVSNKLLSLRTRQRVLDAVYSSMQSEKVAAVKGN